MWIKSRGLVIGIIIFIIFSFYADYANSGRRIVKYKEIKIAYMNGYYDALHLNVKKIKEIQEDEKLLVLSVRGAAEKYISIVERMNQ